MRSRIEDLLKVRDGEPLDAETRRRLLDDPAAREELDRLEHVRRALHELPLVEPPSGSLERILARAAVQATERRATAWRIGLAACAAGVAVAALTLAVVDVGSRGEEPAPRAAAGPPAAGPELRPTPAGDAAPDAARGAYQALLEESARLERRLASLRESPRLVRAGTAGTIAGLEDQIALLDEQLSFAAARDLGPEERQALWRERVEVMNALLHVRYAQSGASGFETVGVSSAEAPYLRQRREP